MQRHGETYWLSNVAYSGAKRQIVVTFSNAHAVRVARFAFFPRLFVHAKSKDAVREVLSLLDGQQFTLRELSADRVEVAAANDTVLKTVAKLLHQALGATARPLLPERQFLLERGWRYFDAFAFEGEWVRTKSEGAPACPLEGFVSTVDQTIEEMSEVDPKSAHALAVRLHYARLLGIAPACAPQDGREAAQEWAQNVCHQNEWPAHAPADAQPGAGAQFAAPGYFEEVSELDFSGARNQLFIRHNLGAESMQCACCAPGAQGERTLPNAMARVAFECDGLFYRSQSPLFAHRYHATHPGAAQRDAYARKWFMPVPPVGPTRRGEDMEVPLSDALMLLREGTARVLDKRPAWACTKTPSFAARALEELESAFAKSAAARDFFGFAQRSALEEMVAEAGLAIANACGAHVADALLALEAETVQSFSEFAKKCGQRVVLAERGTALLEAKDPAQVARDFAQQSGSEVPRVRATKKSVVIE